MAHSTNQVPLGEKLYFFTSKTPADTSCLIMAHGGWLHGDGMFALPAGITMHYFVPHGDALSTNTTHSVLGTRVAMNAANHETGPTPIRNYSLYKVTDLKDKAFNKSYQEIEGLMDLNAGMAGTGNNWSPHIVTIRRRFKGIGKLVQLSEVVTAVRQHNPAITDFYYNACRGDASQKWWKSLAVRGYIQVFG